MYVLANKQDALSEELIQCQILKTKVAHEQIDFFKNLKKSYAMNGSKKSRHPPSFAAEFWPGTLKLRFYRELAKVYTPKTIMAHVRLYLKGLFESEELNNDRELVVIWIYKAKLDGAADFEMGDLLNYLRMMWLPLKTIAPLLNY